MLLTDSQKSSLSQLFTKSGDPDIFVYSVDDKTDEVVARIPVKLSEYVMLMKQVE
jgi:hypothetical protein